MSTRELIDQEVARLPEELQREVYDFVRSLQSKAADEPFNGAALSESALAKEWDTQQEDEAWRSL